MNDDAMSNFDEGGMDPESMSAIYAKTLYALRESRKALLLQYRVSDEQELLENIRCGDASEHPAYDHYLSALIVEQMRMQVRAEMLAQAGGTVSEEVPSISVPLMLKDRLETDYADRLTELPRLAQDALLLSFDTGLMMEVRYFSSSEYAIRWSWGEAEFCIDTAPVHSNCGSFPNHLHRDDGAVTADPVSRPGTDCWSNFSAVVDALLADPLLEGAHDFFNQKET